MELWTFAFQCTIDQWNATPKKKLNYLTSDEAFTGMTKRTKSKCDTFRTFHPLGCPVYVLGKKLANGNSAPKWNPRSK
eukprot:12128936-Ditylum_brightwellii.AAC.1